MAKSSPDSLLGQTVRAVEAAGTREVIRPSGQGRAAERHIQRWQEQRQRDGFYNDIPRQFKCSLRTK